jgi:hypothetical protein
MLALAVAAAGCSAREDRVAAEIACQQRLVDVPSRLLVAWQARRGKAVAALYEQIGRRYDDMSLDGCTDDQRVQAKRLARMTHDIAGDAASLTDPRNRQGPPLQANASLMEFRSRLEGFENRRILMQQDLERMRAVRLR